MMKLTLAILISFSSVALAKRSAPPKIAPLVKNGVEYFYVIEPLTTGCTAEVKSCGQRVFMTATIQKNKMPLWKTELYQNKIDPKKEADAQMIYPKSMSLLKRNRVELIDETTRHFILSEGGGKMEWPAEMRKYRGRR